ncbi:MAG: phosphoribosylformylglycinamidine synthase subunit PurQ [Acidobacteriota bacterium]
MKAAVIVFPGSNCDHDAVHALREIFSVETHEVWHGDTSLPSDTELVVLPGGFSYGDYLRSGAIARFSPIMDAVQAHAKAGRPTLGICNGFQVLVESHLLPGALLPNRGLKFCCRVIHLKVDGKGSPFTADIGEDEVMTMPVAHHEGRYHADEDTLDRLEGEGLVAFRYCGPDGSRGEAHNPNGSLRDIAGLMNPGGNVLGLMPHPERAVETVLGSADGRRIFESLLAAGRRAA